MATPERNELWGILDWTWWFNGLGDEFRESLATKMTAALTPEEQQKAISVIERWRDYRGYPKNLRRYQHQKEEIAQLKERLDTAIALSEEHSRFAPNDSPAQVAFKEILAALKGEPQ